MSSRSTVEEKSISIDGENEKSVKDPNKHERGAWGNKLQFILTCLGCAVGLGNIWRFPSRAYENGGSAFLIPYVICGIFFGLPVVYSEFIIGQYAGVSSCKIFNRYAPAAQGIGWAMVFQEITVSTYYTVILTWSAVYIGYVVSGQSHKWAECNNSWNTDLCAATSEFNKCFEMNSSLPFYDPILKGCAAAANNLSRSSTLEFFQNHITKRSTDILDINEINWYVAIPLFVMWFLIAVALIKGIKILGYLSYVTSTVPYIIVLILFFRGVTLDGAMKGINYYLLEPDFSKLTDPMTWANALQQLAFSLSIGTGALMTMASYNKKSNNCFRDALVVVIGDTVMSLIGGVAVFSILGFLSERTGKEINELAEGGPSLVFIAYPEALALIPFHFVWEFLFFVMFLLLGISTESVMVQTLAACMCDQFEFLRKRAWIPVISICFLFFSLGLIMCTDAGWYWFLVSDEFTGSTGLTMIIALTFITFIWIYGVRSVMHDLTTMFGKPAPLTSVLRWLGKQSPIWIFSWTFICPIGALIITGILCIRGEFTATIDGREYSFPLWATIFGWFTTLGPLLAVPIFFFRNVYKARKEGKPFMSLFRPTAELHTGELFSESKKTSKSAESE